MKTITKYLLLTLAVLLIAGGTGFGYSKVLGYYSFIGDTIYAVNENVCYHEIAHKMDFDGAWLSGKWISKSEGWKQAHPGYHGDLTELYADIFQDCNGHAECVPEHLQKFYDFGLGFTLIQERCSHYGMPEK